MKALIFGADDFEDQELFYRNATKSPKALEAVRQFNFKAKISKKKGI